MRSLSIRPHGLWTDPNPHSEVPDGALRTATNVVHRRKGILEPRPGFADAVSEWTPPTGTVRFAIPFDGDVLVMSLNGVTWTAKWLSDGDTVTAAVGSIGGKFVGHAKARQSLYITSSFGVQKITGAGVASCAEAGMCRGLQGLVSLVSTGTTWLPTTEYVAYRVLFKRIDANDYTLRGAPSGRMVERNTDGADRAVSLRIPLPSSTGLVAGDSIEVYRSIATSNSKPSDDLFLALDYTITAADLTAGYVDIEDHTPENSLGQALYTNDLQQGATRENGRPPVCRDMALYKGSVFFAHTTSRAARVYRCLSTQDWRLYGNADGIDGDFTNADATVTNIGGIAAQLTRAGGITVGQYIVEDGVRPGAAGTYIPAGTKVASLNAPDSIEMSNAATGTVLNEPLNFCDVVTIGGTDFVAWTTTDPTASPPTFRADTAEVAPQLVRDMAQELAYVINYQGTYSASVVSLGVDEFGILIEDLLTTSDQVVEFTNGYAWSPGGASYTINGETDLQQDVKPNRLYWSKTDLPEAVPPVYFTDIGEEDAAILRILATRDALWVLKEDGVFRLTGAGADSGWRVDPRGPSIRLLSRKAAGVLEDHAWAWTETGVIALSDVAEQPVSQPSIGETLRAIESAIAAAGGSEGAWMATSETDGELYLGVPASASDEYASDVYVFNTRTLSWVHWDLDAWLMVHDPGTDKLVMLERDGTDYVVKRSKGTEQFSSIVEWQARSEKDPATPKIWARGSFEFLSLAGAVTLTAGYTSDISDTETSAQLRTGTSAGIADTNHAHVPIWPPRAHAWSAVLYPKITILNSLFGEYIPPTVYTHPDWELVGIDLHYEPIGAGGARRNAP